MLQGISRFINAQYHRVFLVQERLQGLNIGRRGAARGAPLD